MTLNEVYYLIAIIGTVVALIVHWVRNDMKIKELEKTSEESKINYCNCCKLQTERHDSIKDDISDIKQSVSGLSGSIKGVDGKLGLLIRIADGKERKDGNS